MAASVVERPALAQFLIILASLVCGAGMWLVVQLTATQEITLIIDVVPDKVAPEVDLVLNPSKVPVKFSFPATESGRMKPDNFEIVVNYEDLKERIGSDLQKVGTSNLTKEQVRDKTQDPGANITPTEILDPQIEWSARLRHAPAVIEPVVTGQPAQGFVFDPQKAFVDGRRELTVLLTAGKQEELRRSGESTITLRTTPIDISGRHGILREQVELVLPVGVSLLPGQSPSRIIVLELPEETVTRTIEKVPLTYQFLFQGEALRAVVEPPAVDVVLTGRASDVNAVRPEMLMFGLFGVVERAGERREIPVEVRINDPVLRLLVTNVETRPRTVTVSIHDSAEPSTPAPVANDTPTSPSATLPSGEEAPAPGEMEAAP